MKTKLDVFALSDTSIKDYQPKLRNEIRRLEASGERCPFVVFAEYEFNCGTTGALLLIGELSGDLGRFVKQNRKTRNAQKDYGEGECWVEASPKGNQLHINISEGVNSPRLAKGLKKTKLNIPVSISKGKETAQLTEDPEQEPSSSPADKKNNQTEQLQAQTEQVKQLFSTVKDTLAKASQQALSGEERAQVQTLQQAIQAWLGLYQQSDPSSQQQYGEQSLKLQAQGQKISQFLTQKPANNPEPASSQPTISQSVGRGGKNLPDEVKLIQQGLNRFKANLAENGICDAKTIAAIEGLERAKLGTVSGLIEPSSKLLKLLLPR